MLKNLLYAILLGVGMAACLADRDNSDDATITDTDPAVEGGPMTETVELETPEATPDPADLLISKGRVGNIRIGMPIEEMRSQVPSGQQIKDTTLQLEGQQYTAYVFSSPNSPSGLLVEQVCEPDCRVWRISVSSNAYQTAQGIGVGSKYSEVAQHYPISYTSLGEAGFVAVSETAGLSFILGSSQLDKNQLHRMKPDQVPANTLVQGILVY
ncbi:mechanosensitive ion channel protein MscS [uncultured Pontibacter sp.]|uniref:mechanosensitive ion channel protein MscS n=1 Tax=uncultured Pontibacter sp. TaxID=453356 RepID=UPI00262F987C|nr:mechanosensitive ion channel protein MscS [uncultured Pontibacter sp.]